MFIPSYVILRIMRSWKLQFLPCTTLHLLCSLSSLFFHCLVKVCFIPGLEKKKNQVTLHSFELYNHSSFTVFCTRPHKHVVQLR